MLNGPDPHLAHQSARKKDQKAPGKWLPKARDISGLEAFFLKDYNTGIGKERR
jgi:hypothetical protein